MRITVDMLLYVLEETETRAQNDAYMTALSGQENIRKICLWKGESRIRPEALYCVVCEDEKAFSKCVEESGIKKPSVLLFPSKADAEKMVEMLTDIRSNLLEWDLKLMEGILRKKDPEEVFTAINELIDRDFAIVNMDMQYVYCTEGYAESRSLMENRRLPTSLFQDLVASKKFHEAALEKGAFYYYTDSVDRMNLCHNIFAGDQYIARIVMTLKPGEQRLPGGAEELFSLYAGHVQEMFTYNSVIREKNAREQMRELCKLLLNNQPVDQPTLQDVLEEFSWKQRDDFIAILLKFNTESGWDAQLYMMLPYLCTVLETEWPGSYTMCMDSEILLVLNISNELTREMGGNKEKCREKILQKLAYFVRENTCKAGVSTVFQDFALLQYARDAADAAYEIGMRQHPHHWYFLFDDIRLAYMMREVSRHFPEELLVHPAVHVLREYDSVHKSELNRTLSVYLKNNLNMTAAAEELYIHRTSFCRRINQIRKLTNLKLEDPDTVLTLLLSYQILK